MADSFATYRIFPITSGSLLVRTFKCFGADVFTFVTIALIVHTPLLLFRLIAESIGFTKSNPEVVFLIETFVSPLVLTPFATAALVYGVFSRLQERPITVDACLRVGMARWLRVLGLTIVVGILTGIAAMACFFPALIVACGLFIAVPALIVEEITIEEAYKRSWSLTKGHRLSIFGMTVLIYGLLMVFGVVLGVIFYSEENSSIMAITPLLGFLAEFVVTTVFSSLLAIAATIAYHDIRAHKEGLAPEELAAVFD